MDGNATESTVIASKDESKSPEQHLSSASESTSGLPDDLHIPRSSKTQQILRAQFRQGQAEALLRVNGELVKICVDLTAEGGSPGNKQTLEKDFLARLASNLAAIHALSQSHESLANIKPVPILTDVPESYPQLHLAYTKLRALCQAATAFERQVTRMREEKDQRIPRSRAPSQNQAVPAADTAMGPPALPTAQSRLPNPDRSEDPSGHPAKRRKTSGASLMSTSSPSRPSAALPESTASPANGLNQIQTSIQPTSQQDVPAPAPARNQTPNAMTTTSMPLDDRPVGQQQPPAHQSTETPQMHPALMHMANQIKALQQRSVQLEWFMKSPQWPNLTEEQKQRVVQDQAQIQATIQNNIAQFRQQYGPTQEQPSNDVSAAANMPSSNAPVQSANSQPARQDLANIEGMAPKNTNNGTSLALGGDSGMYGNQAQDTSLAQPSSIQTQQQPFSSSIAPVLDSEPGVPQVQNTEANDDDDTAFIDSFLV